MSERIDQETHPKYNAPVGGLAVEQGSAYAEMMRKFEQFPSQWGHQPGNPYQYRPFPKMVYRAELYKGKPVCMAAPPDPMEFPNPGDFQRAQEAAFRFSERCQRIVNDERELQAAKENGFRESPEEAVTYLKLRQGAEFEGVAHRNYEDRNMSDAAKAEAAAEAARIFDEEGRQAPEIPEKRRRGRPRKAE